MNNSRSDSDSRAALRRELRRRRSALSAGEQQQASAGLYRRLVHHPYFLRAERLAFYFPADHEIDPLPLLFAALRRRRHCYLPVLSTRHQGRIAFVRYREGDPLSPNRWGIPEPAGTPREFIPPLSLDLVLMPLVGFAEDGSRLGMGKGFYDRSFGFRRRSNMRRPLLMGLAHECQKTDGLVTADWDVPLDAVATDQRVYLCNRTSQRNPAVP